MSDLFGRSQGGGHVNQPIQSIPTPGVGATAYPLYTPNAGKLGLVAAISFAYAGTITGVQVNVGRQVAGINYFFWQQPAVVQNQIYTAVLPSPFYMEPGQSAVIQITGVTVGGSNFTINLDVIEFSVDSAYHP